MDSAMHGLKILEKNATNFQETKLKFATCQQLFT